MIVALVFHVSFAGYLFCIFPFRFSLIFRNCRYFLVFQRVLRLCILFFCNIFFLQETSNLLLFSTLSRLFIRKFTVLCFVHIDFILDRFYICLLSILLLILRLVFCRFCNINVRPLGR